MNWLYIAGGLVYLSIVLIIGVFTVFEKDANPRWIEIVIWPFTPLMIVVFILGVSLLKLLLNPISWIIFFLIGWILFKG
jgi:hypothetical protein